jgi:hypothetical protein
MMAKMFYTLEEAQSALGKNEEEIKQFAREGRLREFRDGPRLMFKADQVEQLKSELGGAMADHVDLGTSDSGGLIGLVDTGGGPSGSGITMSESDTGQSSSAGMRMKDDTALAADLGLSGSMGGVPSPGRPASSGTGLSGTATGRQSGINVFGAEDVERVDPSAQTAISGAVREQVNLEGVGSGSGLLDLTRESDDTSLGAVLDEIAPSARLSPSDVNDAGSGSGTGLEDAAVAASSAPTRGAAGGGPVYIQALDPSAAAFGAAALAAALTMLFAAYVLISAMVGTHPQATVYFADKSPFMPALFGLGLTVIFFVMGLVLGKAMARS